MSDQNTILPDIFTDETKIFILSADLNTWGHFADLRKVLIDLYLCSFFWL